MPDGEISPVRFQAPHFTISLPSMRFASGFVKDCMARLDKECSSPEVLHSLGLLSPTSLLLRPHAPVHALPPLLALRIPMIAVSEHGPSLLCMPGLVAVPPPLRRRPPQVHLSELAQRVLPSPTSDRLGTLTFHLNRVRVVPITALQRFPNVAARSLASPSARPPLARARALPSELSCEWLPISHVQFATTLSDSCIGWTPTNWTDMFTGCT